MTEANPDVWEEIERRLSWRYPFGRATISAAKTSVSTLRRQAVDNADEDALPVSGPAVRFQTFTRQLTSNGVSRADAGTTHHRFLQFVSLDHANTVEGLKREAERLLHEQILSADDVASLNIRALAAFWQSELGRKVRAQAGSVSRELEFTARFSHDEVATAFMDRVQTEC